MENAPPTTHRISEFFQWHKEGRLILNPPYQRKPVWSIRNKSYLIDTILNGLPLPEIYMQVKTDSDGRTKYIIVDGQQRLNSILSYIEGEYAILEDEDTQEYRGKEFSDLSDQHKQDFWSYPLVVRELKTNKENQVKGIFKRLNKNVMPLTPQELIHSTYSGQFISLVEDLADKEFWADNKIVSPENIRRMKDAEFVSELLVGMIEGAQEGTKSLERYYQLYDTDFAEKEKWDKLFRKTQDHIEDLLGDLRGTNWNSKSDFYALFLAIASILKDHIILLEKKTDIQKRLIEFRRRVNLEKEASDDAGIKEYHFTIAYGHTSGRENRTKRVDLVNKLILPYVIPRDAKRGFTKEQRQLIWDMSKNKLCAICHKKVPFDNYSVDHKIPHSKGGLTVISNGEVTHRIPCNPSKGNRLK